MYDFSGKVALVTGGNRGLGHALCEAFAGEGATVCVVARESDAAREAAYELRRNYGVEAIGKTCDVRDAQRVETVVGEVLRRFGKIDLLVNNAAALGHLEEIADVDPAIWTATIDTNLNGSFYFARCCLRSMKKSGSGRIVFVSSSVGREIRAQWGAYCISKHAVEGLMQLIALECASSGVVTCSINPGGTATEMRRAAFPDEDPSKLPTAAAVAGSFLKILRQKDCELNGRAFNARNFA